MEQLPAVEKITHVLLDTYLDFIASLNTIDGKLIEDEDHAFYVWVTNEVLAYQNIDGTTLLALYEKNVRDGDMDKATFYRYCDNHGFASPVTSSDHGKYQLKKFEDFLDETQRVKKEEYSHWAKEQGINFTPGAVTVFLDGEGNQYRVKTDFQNYGEILTTAPTQ